MNLNTIPSTGEWGDKANRLNDNSDKIINEFVRLESAVDNMPVNPIFQNPVATVAALTATYPEAEYRWTALVEADQYFYQYNGINWAKTGLKNFPENVVTVSSLTPTVNQQTTTTPNNKAIFDSLANKASIGYFFGVPSIDFATKIVSFPLGYFAHGKTLLSVASQLVAYTIEDSLHIALNLLTSKWTLIPVTNSSILQDHIYVGVIDMGGKTMSGNFRGVDLGKFQFVGKQGWLVGSTFSININFNTSTAGWTLNSTTGYLATANGNTLVTVHPKSASYNTNNIYYVYADAGSGELIVFPYHEKPSISFLNLFYLGVVIPATKKVILSVSGLIVDGKEYTNFTTAQAYDITYLKDQMGSPVKAYFPYKDWVNRAWNTVVDMGYTYVDTRAIISKYNPLNNIKVSVQTSGSINIHLTDILYKKLYSYEKVCVAGVNTFTINDINYSESMRIGIEPLTAKLQTIAPPDNIGLGKRIDSLGNVLEGNYAYAYEIETKDLTSTIGGRLKVLEDRYMPTSNDINKILAENNGVAILQPRDYLITSPINMHSGYVVDGSFGKTNLILTNGCETIFRGAGTPASKIEDIKISNVKLIGTQADYDVSMNGINSGTDIINTEEEALAFTYMGNEKGIHLTSCEGVILENVRIRKMTGHGMKIEGVGRDYFDGMKVNNVFIKNCYNGVYGLNEHEYSSYDNFIISACQIGLVVSSGNLTFSNSIVTRCRVGVMYTGGYNHAHGIMGLLEIKHNQIAGLYIQDVINGQSFQGMNISSCDVVIRDSKGVYFDNLVMIRGKITCSNEKNVGGSNAIGTLVRMSEAVTLANTGNLQVINTLDLF